MKKLLEKLKILDRACYDEIWQWVLWREENWDYASDDPVYLKHRDDAIRGGVQRAVAARGWHWRLEDSDPSVRTNVDGFVCDICDKNYDVLSGYIQGDSPAKSVLTAYIAAMKAQP